MRPLRYLITVVVVSALAFWCLSTYTPCGKPSDLPTVPLRFEGQQAMQYLTALTRTYGNRVIGTRQGSAAGHYVAEQFRAMGLQVQFQKFREIGSLVDRSNYGWFKGINVLGVSPGTEQGTILFTAHYDTVPTAPEGAFDNGSGTAVIMELARILSSDSHRYTYVFAALDGEEVGMAGARRLMNHRIEALMDIRLAVNLDMVGHRSVTGYRAYYTHYLSPEARRLVRSLGAENGFSLPKADPFDWPMSRGTDAAIFAFRAIPSLDLAENVSEPVFLHDKYDTLDRISPESLQRVGRIVEELVRVGDLKSSFTPSHGFLAGDQDNYLPAWRYRLGGFLILLALAAPLLLRSFRKEWLASQAMPLSVLLVLSILTGAAAAFSQLWSGHASFVLLPLLGMIIIAVLQACVQRIGTKVPDPGLGRLLIAATPAFLFGFTWWMTGLWFVGFLPAVVASIPAVFVSWRPGWSWRLLDVILILFPLPLIGVIVLVAWLLAPGHIFPLTKLPLFITVYAAAALAGIWGLFGRRPPRTVAPVIYADPQTLKDEDLLEPDPGSTPASEE